MRRSVGISGDVVVVEDAVGEGGNASAVADLDGMVVEDTFFCVEVAEIVVDVKAIHVTMFEVDVLHTVHRSRTPITLHIAVLYVYVGTVGDAQHIA